MTTEREQLELAAKACGIKLHQWVAKGCWSDDPSIEGFQTAPPDYDRWNPAHDDGDCARMEAALGIELTWFFDRVDALACDVAPVVEYFKDHNGDKNAARRAASVAVASEIGRLK